MSISRKSRKQVLSMLQFLKGIPCNVTLYYLDEDLERTRERGVHLNPNTIPLDIINGKRDYEIKVKLDGFLPFNFKSYRPVDNEYEFSSLEKTISQYSDEDIVKNNIRWRRLDDILNDPNPPPLI